MSFGPACTYMLLRLLYGLRWSETEAPRALATYCVYILLLAVNGILEAFVHAVAESRCARSCICCPAAAQHVTVAFLISCFEVLRALACFAKPAGHVQHWTIWGSMDMNV